MLPAEVCLANHPWPCPHSSSNALSMMMIQKSWTLQNCIAVSVLVFKTNWDTELQNFAKQFFFNSYVLITQWMQLILRFHFLCLIFVDRKQRRRHYFHSTPSNTEKITTNHLRISCNLPIVISNLSLFNTSWIRRCHSKESLRWGVYFLCNVMTYEYCYNYWRVYSP